ncbi:CDP-alcohol phosphatidyltransferase [Altererythrobacter xixiisoli]|uniref:CDP-alcohol phosphatidyltransferase n=2 Tax=Croceibacterium xixiisoli TaxID=1476466 RepID=A0A6I4TWN5_9SPHN|nr:CDP-alcohol phosphatidyltransferase [Croceibacterium xixiisoli]
MSRRRTEGAGADRPQGRRPAELQIFSNRALYHPFAAWLALRLASTPATPNMVSVAGGLCVVGAAVAYTQVAWPVSVMLGLLFHMSWHILDGADGDLARLTGQSGPVGELVDGICDYASHLVLYVLLALFLQAQIGPVAWFLMVLSGISHIAQSNHFEVQRRQYQWWVYGVPWLRSTSADDLADSGIFAALRSAYLGLASRMAPGVAAIDSALADAGLDPERLDRSRASVRGQLAPLLSGMTMLSANHRTIILALSMAAGSPAYYFLYQAVVLNLVLVRSIRRFDRAKDRIDDELSHADPNTRR